TRAARLLHRRGRPMCPAAEQTDPGGVRPLPTLSRAGDQTPAEPAGGRRTRRSGDGRLAEGVAGPGPRHPDAPTEVPPWRPMVPPADHADRLLPPEPAEHADGAPSGGGLRRGLRVCSRLPDVRPSEKPR